MFYCLFHDRLLVLSWLISSIALGIVLPGVTSHIAFGFLPFVCMLPSYYRLFHHLHPVVRFVSLGFVPCVTSFILHVTFGSFYLCDCFSLNCSSPDVVQFLLPWVVPNMASYRIRVYPLRLLFSKLFHDSFCASPLVFVPLVSLPLFTFGLLPLVDTFSIVPLRYSLGLN